MPGPMKYYCAFFILYKNRFWQIWNVTCVFVHNSKQDMWSPILFRVVKENTRDISYLSSVISYLSIMIDLVCGFELRYILSYCISIIFNKLSFETTPQSGATTAPAPSNFAWRRERKLVKNQFSNEIFVCIF